MFFNKQPKIVVFNDLVKELRNSCERYKDFMDIPLDMEDVVSVLEKVYLTLYFGEKSLSKEEKNDMIRALRGLCYVLIDIGVLKVIDNKFVIVSKVLKNTHI
jgi:hypothetical protein